MGYGEHHGRERIGEEKKREKERARKRKSYANVPHRTFSQYDHGNDIRVTIDLYISYLDMMEVIIRKIIRFRMKKAEKDGCTQMEVVIDHDSSCLEKKSHKSD